MSGDDLAFPLVARTDVPSEVHTGLSKRELFAAMAMQGLVTIDPTTYRISNPDGRMIYQWYAADAVSYADALIAELNKEQSK